MTMSKKLYLGFGAAFLITVVMGILAFHNLSVMGEEITHLATVTSRSLYLAGDISRLTADTLSSAHGMNLRAHMNDPRVAAQLHEQAIADTDRLKAEGEEFASTTSHPELRQKMQTEILDKIPALTDGIREDWDLIEKSNLTAADDITRNKLTSQAAALESAANDMVAEENKIVAAYSEAAIGAIPAANITNIAMIVLAVLVGCGVIWLVRHISSVLLSSIVELGDGAEQVATAASQVSSSSQSLAQGASQQAASLEETSASSEEINSMARKNTDNSRSTAELLLRSQEKVGQANRYLQEMVVSMNLITDSSGKISKIIKVIDEIAFQTNILALNAAVEAARAGEAGMGFAVVADEVRSLAQRSAQAAKDTAILIEDSISRSNEGKVKVDQVALAIQAVTEDSAKVKVMVDEVSLGSEEQSRGIDQIGRSISQMEQVTQTNAASAEESAAAAQQLSAQSETLKSVINRLHVMLGSDSHSASSFTRPAFKSVAARRKFRPQPVSGADLGVGSFAASPKRRAVTQPADVPTKNTDHADEFPMEESFQSF